MKKLILLVPLLFCSICLGGVVRPIFDPFAAHLDWINPKNYGAVGDGDANDTDAIQAALDSMVDGDTFYLPAGDFNTTSVLTAGSNDANLHSCNFIFDGIIRANDCSGITFERLMECNIDINGVRHNTVDWGDSNYWGIKFKRLNYCNVNINLSWHFTYGLYFDGDGGGISYNQFSFNSVRAKYGLYFKSQNNGWLNANSYHGGRIWVDSGTKRDVITYEATGTLDPDITGTFEYHNEYNGKSSYKLSGQEWYIWWDNVDTWVISTAQGTADANYWERTSSIRHGDYSPTGGASGDASVPVVGAGWGIYFADDPSENFYNHSFYDAVLEGLHNGIHFSKNYYTLLANVYFEGVDDNHIASSGWAQYTTWILGNQGLDRTKLDLTTFRQFAIIGYHPDANSSIMIDGSDYGGIVAVDATDDLAALGRLSYDKTNDYWKFEGGGLTVDSNSIRVTTAKTPSAPSDTGTQGDICWDSDYVYVAVANNTWKRSALSSWGFAGETMIYEDTNTMVFEDGNTMVYD